MTNEGSAISTVPPIRREVLVDAGPEIAFDVFTAGIGRWWPIADARGRLSRGRRADDGRPGEGMTILRLPGTGQLARATISPPRTTSASPRDSSR